MNGLDQLTVPQLYSDEAAWPVLICLLGNFRLRKAGHTIAIQGSGKTETLLGYLALHCGRRVPREKLVHMLWPDGDPALARQSLNSLVYSLHKLVGNSIDGSTLVLHEEGYYRLNIGTGVGVDIACFDAWARAGNQQVRMGDLPTAATSYTRAAGLYRGDLCVVPDVYAVVERERLRSSYLTLLAYLADYHYNLGEYEACIENSWRLLACDPCREDAHRLLGRCYVRRGERAGALHHYRFCVNILHAEFDAVPDPETVALFDQIRLQPKRI